MAPNSLNPTAPPAADPTTASGAVQNPPINSPTGDPPGQHPGARRLARAPSSRVNSGAGDRAPGGATGARHAPWTPRASPGLSRRFPPDAPRSPALAGLATTACNAGFAFSAPSFSPMRSPAGPNGGSVAPGAVVAFTSMTLDAYRGKQQEANVLVGKIDAAQAKHAGCDVCGVAFHTLTNKERLICCSAPAGALVELHKTDKSAAATLQQLPFSPASAGPEDRAHVHQCCSKCAGDTADAHPRAMTFFCGSWNSTKNYAPKHGFLVDKKRVTPDDIGQLATCSSALRSVTATVPFWVGVAESRYREKGYLEFSRGEQRAFESCFKLHPALQGPLSAADAADGEPPILMGLCAPCVSAFVDWLLFDERSPWSDAVFGNELSTSPKTFPRLHHASSKPAANTAADALAELGGAASEALKGFASMEVEQQQPPAASSGEELRRVAASDPDALRRLQEERGAIAPPPPAPEAPEAPEAPVAPTDEAGFGGFGDDDEPPVDADDEEEGEAAAAARAEEAAQAAAELAAAKAAEEAARQEAERAGQNEQRLAEQVQALKTQQEELQAATDLRVKNAEAAARKKAEKEASTAAKAVQKKRKEDEKATAAALAAAQKERQAAARTNETANATLAKARQTVKKAKTAAVAAAAPAAGAQGAARRGKAYQEQEEGSQYADNRAVGDFGTTYALKKARGELNAELGLPHNYLSMKGPDKHEAMCVVRDELVALREFKAKAEAAAKLPYVRKAPAPAAAKAAADTDEEEGSEYLRSHKPVTIPKDMMLLPAKKVHELLSEQRAAWAKGKALVGAAEKREDLQVYRTATALQEYDSTTAQARAFLKKADAYVAQLERGEAGAEAEQEYKKARDALTECTELEPEGSMHEGHFDELARQFATGGAELPDSDARAEGTQQGDHQVVEERLQAFGDHCSQLLKDDPRFSSKVPAFEPNSYPKAPVASFGFLAHTQYDFTPYEVGDYVRCHLNWEDGEDADRYLMQIVNTFDAGQSPGDDAKSLGHLCARALVHYYELKICDPMAGDQDGCHTFRLKEQLRAGEPDPEEAPPPPAPSKSKAAGKRRVSFEADAPKAKRGRRGA